MPDSRPIDRTSNNSLDALAEIAEAIDLLREAVENLTAEIREH